MNARRIFKIILTLNIVGMLSACSAKTSVPTTEIGALQITATQPIPSATPLTVADKISIALAKKLDIPVEDVQVHTIDETEWPNSCLGAPSNGEVCAEVVTPGYGGILITSGVLYEFHSDQTAENVRFIPGAALAARQTLLNQLGVERQAVSITNIKEVTWKNDCLEIVATDQVCTANEIPGYSVTLETGGKTYEYHTDETGGDVRLAVAPEISPIKALISWSEKGEFQCHQAEMDAEQIVFGLCGGPQMDVPLPVAERSDDIKRFASKYSGFSAETQAGGVALNGTGVILATPADQRMVAEWAKATMLEAMGGGGEAAWGLAFAWHRAGGIAGFCEDVSFYLSGLADVSSCKGDVHERLGKTWLTGNQMWQLYSWIDTYQGFDYEGNDPASADAMTIRLIFNGKGEQQAGEFEQAKLIALGNEVVGEVQTTPNTQDLEAARNALQEYLAALAASNYTSAVNLYGGSYEVLQNNNPTTPADSYATLFRQGCTMNGFICNLTVLNFVQEVQLSETDFRFTVELQKPDGNLFLLGPCCGANPAIEPPWSQFDFQVSKVDGIFKVMDLPVYTP